MGTDKNAEFDTASFEHESIASEPKGKAPVRPVASGARRKTLLSRVQKSTVAKDMKEIARYLIFDVILPDAKRTIYDAICGGTRRALWRDSKDSPPGGSALYDRPSYMDVTWSRSSYPVVPYYNTSTRSDTGRVLTREVPRSDLQIYFQTRSEAQNVLDAIFQKYDDSGYVTVNDYYVMSGLSSDFTKEPYGWESLSVNSVRVEHTPYGFTIRMPKPKILNW